MIEFESILETYSLEGYSMYSHSIADARWGDKDEAYRYLSRFWLPLAEYSEKWKPIQDRIFIHQDSGLPERVFASNFELLATIGGCLFTCDDFRRLQACIRATGDKYLIVVENTFGGRIKEPTFRMKYPADITWEELNGGNFASSIMLEMPHKEYFVFGESAAWGRYAANDYEVPLDILGFESAYSDVFRKHFPLTEEDRLVLLNCLPAAYM
jgi:hypothetical protein